MVRWLPACWWFAVGFDRVAVKVVVAVDCTNERVNEKEMHTERDGHMHAGGSTNTPKPTVHIQAVQSSAHQQQSCRHFLRIFLGCRAVSRCTKLSSYNHHAGACFGARTCGNHHNKGVNINHAERAKGKCCHQQHLPCARIGYQGGRR